MVDPPSHGLWTVRGARWEREVWNRPLAPALLASPNSSLLHPGYWTKVQ